MVLGPSEGARKSLRVKLGTHLSNRQGPWRALSHALVDFSSLLFSKRGPSRPQGRLTASPCNAILLSRKPIPTLGQNRELSRFLLFTGPLPSQ